MKTTWRDPIHHWLAACRMLMGTDPSFAIQQATMFVPGQAYDSTLRPGWNHVLNSDPLSEIHERWVFISEDHGATRETPPPGVPPDQMHEVTLEQKDPRKTPLWAAITELASEVRSRNAPGWDAQAVNGAMAAIDSAASLGGRHDPAAADRYRAALTTLRTVMRSAGRGGRIPMADFVQPTYDLINDYLSLKLACQTARELLAVTMASQALIPSLGPPEALAPELRLLMIDHLASRTYDLLRLRRDANLNSFTEATFLASLYSGASLVLVRHALNAGGLDEKQAKRLPRVELNLHEMFAHEIEPALLLPGLFEADRLVAWLVSYSRLLGEPVVETIRRYPLPSQLQAFAAAATMQGLTGYALSAAAEEAASTGVSLDLRSWIRSDGRPFPDELGVKIKMDLTIMAFGAAQNG
jgi:hypothetical protein